VGIARALACEPRVLIADEPTSSLDVSVQAQILNLLLDLRERRGLALLLISHDLSVVSYMTETAAVMYRGRIVERARTEALMSRPMHPYTRALVASIPGAEEPPGITQNDVDDDSGCVFARRCPFVQADCLAGVVELREVRGSEVACLHPIDQEPSSQIESTAGVHE
jgi:oligopeptide/dipeptide ABC transporter ATP-binding protein